MKLDNGNIWVSEVYINATEGYTFGDSDVYESFTNDTGKLYRSCQREYGRCVSKAYIDPADGGKPRAIGWVFVGRQQYEDTGETYLREVWVTLHAPTIEMEMQPRNVHPLLTIGGK